MKKIIIVMVALCLLFGCTKGIISDNTTTQTEVMFENIKQEVEQLTDQINGFASTIEKTSLMSSNMTDNVLSDLSKISDNALNVSSNMGTVAEVMEKTASKTFEELMAQSNTLHNTYEQLNNKTEEFIVYVDGLMKNRSVDEMLSVLSDGNWTDNVKDAMYMRIIAQNPTNEIAFNKYLEFLKEIEAGLVYYYDLHSLLSSALYTVNIENIPSLISEIDKVNSIIDNYVQDDTQILIDGWNNIYEAFEAVSKNFEGKRFTELYESLSEYHELLSSTTIEIDSQYEYAQYINSLYSNYRDYINFADRLLKADYDTLFSMYSTANGIWTTLMTQFMSRDTSKDGVFSNTIEEMLKEIESKGKAINNRFENLLSIEFAYTLVVAQRKIEDNDLIPSLYEVSGDLQSLATVLSSIATTDESYKYLDEYSQYLAKYQRALYVAYQEWAAHILSNVNKAVEKAKTEKKLQILFDEGYFDIDSSLLTPQLKTWYDSLCSQTIIEKSSTPFESLVGTIHTMSLSDMRKIK